MFSELKKFPEKNITKSKVKANLPQKLFTGLSFLTLKINLS